MELAVDGDFVELWWALLSDGTSGAPMVREGVYEGSSATHNSRACPSRVGQTVLIDFVSENLLPDMGRAFDRFCPARRRPFCSTEDWSLWFPPEASLYPVHT